MIADKNSFAEKDQQVLDLPVEEFFSPERFTAVGLSVKHHRTKILKAMGKSHCSHVRSWGYDPISTVGDLIQWDEATFVRLHGAGWGMLRHVHNILQTAGLSLQTSNPSDRQRM